jgi:hypothetical protein
VAGPSWRQPSTAGRPAKTPPASARGVRVLTVSVVANSRRDGGAQAVGSACPRPPGSREIAREVRRPWILGEREHRACCRPRAAGRCRAAHARAAGNQRLLAREAAHLVCAGGRYPAHAGRVGARLLLPVPLQSVMSHWSMGRKSGRASSRHRGTRKRRTPTTSPGPRPASRRLRVAGHLQPSLTELVGMPPSVYRRQAVRATAGMPSWVAKQVTRPVRNQEAPAPEPHLGWLPYGDRPRQEGGKA